MIRPTLPLALLALSALPAAAVTLTLRPTDDVWVYENSVDPGSDPIARVWGDGTRSFKETYPPGQNFSYTYLRFDLSSLAGASYTVDRAVLRITSRAAGYTRQEAVDNPLEARGLGKDFREATWNYSDPTNPNPLPSLFGSGDASAYSSTGDWVIPIDLNQDRRAFGGFFNEAVRIDKALKLALTSRLRVDDMGGQPYRIYTCDFPLVQRQPTLELTLRPGPTAVGDPVPVPEPATLTALATALAALTARSRLRRPSTS